MEFWIGHEVNKNDKKSKLSLLLQFFKGNVHMCINIHFLDDTAAVILKEMVLGEGCFSSIYQHGS